MVFIAHGLSRWRQGCSRNAMPSRWRHGGSRRRPGLPRYLTAFPVTPGVSRLFHTTGDMSRFTCNTSKVVHGAATIAKRLITVHPGSSSNRDEPAPKTGTVRTGLKISVWYLLVFYFGWSVKHLKFAPKWSISCFQSILAAIFATI